MNLKSQAPAARRRLNLHLGRIAMSNSTNSPASKTWPDYRAVWRWHFYAGLLCIPFVIFLCVTGSIYLFKPQIEAAIDLPINHLSGVPTATPSQAVQKALSAHPGWTLHAYQLPTGPNSAAQVIIGKSGVERRVVVDRATLSILRDEREDQRIMQTLFHLHGELLAGDRGSNLIELAASWAIVMILTGLYLWWPRQVRGLGGVLYPRFGMGGRLLLRDLHAVTALWVSAFTLFILISGLPWAKNWGGYLKEVRSLASGTEVHQDWTTGKSSEVAENRAKDSAAMASMPGMVMPSLTEKAGGPGGRSDHDHAEHGGWKRKDVTLSSDALKALDRITPAVDRLGLAYPVLISPPSKPGSPWSGKSDAQNRPLRVDVKIDPKSGAIISRKDFADRPLIDQAVGVGVALHEGQLFGLGNQVLNLTVATGLLTASVSAALLWWRRRASGVLGAPLPEGEPRYSFGLVVICVLLGVLLPEFGLSLCAVLLVEWAVLRRISGVAHWLGFRPLKSAAPLTSGAAP